MSRWLWLMTAVALTSLAAGAIGDSRSEPVPFEADELWGYRNIDGSIAVAPSFHIANDFTPEGIASVAAKDGWAIIDRSGKVILRPLTVDNWPDEFSEGFARFVEDGKVGFFDRAGRKVIPAMFDAAHSYSEGLAAVCRGCRKETHGEHVAWTAGLWGYIDHSGELVIPMHYEAARPFEHGQAEVRVGERWIRIGDNGQPVQADDLICRFETDENRVEFVWDGSESAGLVVDDRRRPLPLACKMTVEAARFVDTAPGAPRYIFEFDATDCRATRHAAASEVSSRVVLVIYPAHGNRGTLFWSDATIMDECEYVELAPTIEAKVKAAEPDDEMIRSETERRP